MQGLTLAAPGPNPAPTSDRPALTTRVQNRPSPPRTARRQDRRCGPLFRRRRDASARTEPHAGTTADTGMPRPIPEHTSADAEVEGSPNATADARADTGPGA